MKNQKFCIIESFGHALNGLKIMVHYERNARIHLVVGLTVVVAGFILQISSAEWIAVVFATGLVPVLELINTSIEYLADYISPELHPAIKIIKDLAAASVLLGAIMAAIIGFIVFIPKILALCLKF